MEIEDKRKIGAFSKLKNNAVLKKLKKVKNIEFIACVFILAIALLLYSVVSNANSNISDTTASTTSSESATDIESRLASILSQIDGAGNVSVMVTYCDEVLGGDSKKISGVIVVASGADDIGVRLELMQAVETALSIDAKLVDVFTKK
ncbi:MAG: hypothetical protein PHE93_03950 [Clostridia bacterium]|nr:hypothetical protein [Clostridia bacterium]